MQPTSEAAGRQSGPPRSALVVLKVSPDDVDIGVFLLTICCVYIYVRLVMSSYLLVCCIYFDAWCIT